ncbi:elongation factor G [Thermodesulfobacterium sp. TA1]|uniref:elongation factor G n=1 Tax=Thermodesulfobacterium sp. TA1 TaxID=2234087 RepID=UPI0012328E7F|nr:elongation factor G [Thermodesulfobacterium sp. TA1]QER42238.1 elongation factor G [Thermodesulfobacterium sp. TA1]
MGVPKVLTILGQTDAGKARLSEAFCKVCGEAIKGQKKESNFYLRVYGFNYKDTPFYLLTTPGDENFLGEIKWALKVSDAAILVVDSSNPIKYHTIRVFEMAKEMEVPLFIFINKLDEEKSNFGQTICDLQDNLEILQVPIIYAFGEKEQPLLVDLIEDKAVVEKGSKIEYIDYPENLKHRVSTLKENLIETAAEGKDELIEKYLDTGSLTKEEILEGLKAGLANNKIALIFTGAAKPGIGVPTFLEYLYQFVPSYELVRKRNETDEKSSGFIFKTIIDPFAGKLSYGRVFAGSFNSDSTVFTSNGKEEKYTQIFVPKGDGLQQVKEVKEGEVIVFAKVDGLSTGITFAKNLGVKPISLPKLPSPMITMALHPETRADEDKISGALTKIKEEDPSIIFTRDEETKELLISGLGVIHIEKTIEKLREKFGVKVKLTTPKIPYRETIKKPVHGVIYRHKKQSGGRGQFAEVHFNLFPLERGKGFEFLETLTGMNVPRNYVPAVEKGVREAMERGPLAGFPVVDVKVQFYDGKSHEVDSSDLAFKIAAIHCFRKGMEQANPVLLEPYIEMEIYVPDETVGDVVGDLNSRRGRVLGIEKDKKMTKISAVVPMAEVQNYVVALQGFTGGRGYFISKFSHYEEAPPFVAEKVIAERKSQLEAAKEE